MNLSQYHQWQVATLKTKHPAVWQRHMFRMLLKTFYRTKTEEYSDVTVADVILLQMSRTLNTAKEYYGCEILEFEEGDHLDGRSLPAVQSPIGKWHQNFGVPESYVIKELFWNRQYLQVPNLQELEVHDFHGNGIDTGRSCNAMKISFKES